MGYLRTPRTIEYSTSNRCLLSLMSLVRVSNGDLGSEDALDARIT